MTKERQAGGIRVLPLAVTVTLSFDVTSSDVTSGASPWLPVQYSDDITRWGVVGA